MDGNLLFARHLTTTFYCTIQYESSRRKKNCPETSVKNAREIFKII